MKVLVTRHINGSIEQEVVDAQHTSIVDFFKDVYLAEEGGDWEPDQWTTVNEYGMFVTCPDYSESYVIIG